MRLRTPLSILWFLLFASPALPPDLTVWVAAQQSQSGKPMLRVEVNLVQLNVAVTDTKGHYVTGLHPMHFIVTEDNITQKIASFGEGNEPQRNLISPTGEPREGLDPSAAVAGANVFVLFDTSNYMYRSFALAQDAIADFVKSLDSPERVAFY